MMLSKRITKKGTNMLGSLAFDIAVYLLLGGFIWFSPREIRLIGLDKPLYQKIALTLVWPIYLLSRPCSFFMKILMLGFLCLVGPGIVFELSETKVYSLSASSITESPYSRAAKCLPMDDAINWELLLKGQEYLSAINSNGYNELMELVDTPAKARIAVLLYVMRNGVIANDTTPSFYEIHQERMPIDCYGAALIAAALLADDGYPPMLLCLRTSPQTFLFDMASSSIHMVYVYKSKGRFGYISLENATDPIFADLDELIVRVCCSMHVVYTQYFLFNLNDLIPNYLSSNSGISGHEVWINDEQATWWDYVLY